MSMLSISILRSLMKSVLLLVGFLPVVVVRFEHEAVAGGEHYVAQPPNENSEGNK